MAAAQHLKLWEGMLGKQVAGSPWSNARHLQKDQAASAVSLFPTSGTKHQNNMENWRKIRRNTYQERKNMDQEPFGHTLRRESNPGLLSERRGAADRQKC